MKLNRLYILLGLGLLLLILSACTAASSTASCAFVVGDGRAGHDAKLHKVIYPGQEVYYDVDSEVVRYVPCNSRNYIINDGTVKNANGERVGDRDVLITATTKTGVRIKVGVRALWTLNQSWDAMQRFYETCFKYQCYSEEDQGGNVNFATPGWNGLLAENFGPALEMSARQAAIDIEDSIWKTNDPVEYKRLADGMASFFADNMAANLGYNIPLFCGSGNSSWSDPANPGEGEYDCQPVRIVVDSVLRDELEESESTTGALELNKQRKDNAEALYGEDASYWLGVQDSIRECQGTSSTCVFYFGEPPSQVPVLPVLPSPEAIVPTEQPTPTPEN